VGIIPGHTVLKYTESRAAWRVSVTGRDGGDMTVDLGPVSVGQCHEVVDGHPRSGSGLDRKNAPPWGCSVAVVVHQPRADGQAHCPLANATCIVFFSRYFHHFGVFVLPRTRRPKPSGFCCCVDVAVGQLHQEYRQSPSASSGPSATFTQQLGPWGRKSTNWVCRSR
jgi:hypothetical protein